jgi:hypothetical protein
MDQGDTSPKPWRTWLQVHLQVHQYRTASHVQADK